MKNMLSAVGMAAIAMSSGLSAAHAGEEVNLYSYRQPFLIKPMLQGFTKKTGIKVNVVYAKKGMLERIKAEGENTPADAVLTTDVGRLSDMVDAGVLASVKSQVLTKIFRRNIATLMACGSHRPPEHVSCSPARSG